MHQYAKHFTLEEAQLVVKDVIPILEDISRLKEILDNKGYDVFRHQYFGGIGPNGQKFFPTEMEELVLKVKEINELGIEIKDLNKGLIDFPHLRHGSEEVYLCYMLGEPTIMSWHSLMGGFPGRKSLEEL
ncbi:MAG TPA: DUF2203 domain-containing protein [Candidatus Kapabacteria bacterium]